MIWVTVAVALAAAATLVLISARRRRRREVTVIIPDLVERTTVAARAFAAAAPWRPSSAADAPGIAAAIETALIVGDPRRALDAAEAALAAGLDPNAGAAAQRVWLAWALCANGEPAAALDQLARAGAPAGPLASYVAARATHLQFEHASGASGAIPPLVTTADLAVVTLASGRGAATWLTGSTEVQLSARQVRAAIAEHREVTARCLGRALDALEAAPGFTEAAYLVARLAIKAGLVPAGREVFASIAPRIAGRPDADAFERDRKDLDDPATAVAAAKTAPPPVSSGKAKRSRSLRVL